MRAVVLPGSGSDEVFVRAAFAAPLAAVGIALDAPSPVRGAGVVDGYRAALDAAAQQPGRFLVGGVSLGAHVAMTWAAQRLPQLGERLAGVLVALPAWTGRPDRAPAARAAVATADLVRAGGVADAVAAARAGAPAWLADELGRAWPRYGAGLAAALRAAAVEPGPSPAQLRAVPVPVGIAALGDDPVHPHDVATRWLSLLPHAVLLTSTLAAFGADHEVIGRASVLSWLRAGGSPS